jgi:hypothetical protein
MLPVLQIMKDRDLWARRPRRGGETWIQQNIDAMPRERSWQKYLLEKNARGPESGADRAAYGFEARRIRYKILSRFAIQKDGVVVDGINARERAQQKAEIDLRTANSGGNQKKRVDTDTNCHEPGLSDELQDSLTDATSRETCIRGAA